MNFEAIQHIPMSQQAHGIDPNHVVFRLRAGRDDLKHCTLFYADRACRLTPVIFSSVEMQVEAQDEWFDYFQVIFLTIPLGLLVKAHKPMSYKLM